MKPKHAKLQWRGYGDAKYAIGKSDDKAATSKSDDKAAICNGEAMVKQMVRPW